MLMKLDKNLQAFFALLRAGLWEQEACLAVYEDIDYSKVNQLAEDHAVCGIIAAGIEHVVDTVVPKETILKFVGSTLQIEQRNVEMDQNVAILVSSFNQKGIEASLVKGQGVAQCYGRPKWRSSGDIDFLLDELNYSKAKDYLSQLVVSPTKEKKKHQKMKHAEFYINNCIIELHGTLHPNLSPKMNYAIDDIQKKMFSEKRFRIWKNGEVEIFMPEPTIDVVFVFTHILQHFFESGIGLRQICDLCRLLWKYNKEINVSSLGSYLKKMGIETEWKAFASLMVTSLGYPKEVMPFYDSSFDRKGDKVLSFIIESGNFGRNLDYSYTKKHKRIIRKGITVFRHLRQALRKTMVFPVDAICFHLYFVKNGLVSAINGD